MTKFRSTRLIRKATIERTYRHKHIQIYNEAFQSLKNVIFAVIKSHIKMYILLLKEVYLIFSV